MSARLDAIWSMMPQRTPTYSISARCAIWAISTSSIVDVEEAAQRAQRRDLERSARRQADAHRQLGRDVDVERRDRVAAARDFLDAAEDVASERLVGQAIAPEPKRPREAFRAQRELVVDAVAERDRRLLRERDRQDEAVVVVGVLADQVDAPRRARDDVGRVAERGEKAVPQDSVTSVARSSRSSVAIGPFWGHRRSRGRPMAEEPRSVTGAWPAQATMGAGRQSVTFCARSASISHISHRRDAKDSRPYRKA